MKVRTYVPVQIIDKITAHSDLTVLSTLTQQHGVFVDVICDREISKVFREIDKNVR